LKKSKKRKKIQKKKERKKESSSGCCTFVCVILKPTCIVFFETVLTKFIRSLVSHKATVVSSTYNPKRQKNVENPILLSALASATPIVAPEWISKVNKEKKKNEKSIFLTFLSQMVEKREVIPMMPYLIGGSTAGPELLLDEMRIEFVGSTAFKDYYSRIVREGGAKVVNRLFQGDLRIDLIISEENYICPNFLVEKEAAKRDIPIVSVDWLTEVISTGLVQEDEATMRRFKAKRVEE
jgi:hypothetical protein